MLSTMANIFDSTIKLKDFRYEGNPQLIEINGKVELTGASPYIMAHYHGLENDYEKITVESTRNYLFDPQISSIRRTLKNGNFIKWEDLSVNKVNTKDYWNFIHEHFPFCDVASYFKCIDLQSYFNIKGRGYDAIIDEIGINTLKNKKILEIGPGYGYLPNVLFNEFNLNSTYYCADIVKRFNHDNFIEVSGYDLNNINDKFDVIIMQDVIQHLGSNIFKEYVRTIKNKLFNENGVLIIGTELNLFEDYSSFFFGQAYESLGLSNINDYLIKLGFEVSYIPFSLNKTKNIGTIIINKNKDA